MFFKKKDSSEEINKIKDAMKEEEKDILFDDNSIDDINSLLGVPEEKIEKPARMSSRIDPQRIDPSREILRESPLQMERSAAPLFVKIERYQDVVSSVNQMKMFISAAKQLFSVLHEIESVRNDAVKVMRITIQRLEKTLTDMDLDLVQPADSVASTEQAGKEVKHIETSLSELQNQLSMLRKELQDLR